jgi:hypothetical protein
MKVTKEVQEHKMERAVLAKAELRTAAIDSGLPTQIPGKSPPIDSILTERGSRYGDFRGHALITQVLKNDIRTFCTLSLGMPIEKKLSPSQVEALDMIMHKIGRILNGDPRYADSWVDIVGYARLIVQQLESPDSERE